jgi:hypothetical protein
VGDVQVLEIEEFTKPRTEITTEKVLVGHRNVNPREVEQRVKQRVIDRYKTKTRKKTVYDTEDVTVVKKVPVYRTEMETERVPVYRTEERTRDVPVYGTVTKTRTVHKKVWVWDPLDLSGGTAIGGDGGRTGHYETVAQEETYQDQIITGYRQETYSVEVFDHHDIRAKEVRVIDHYDDVATKEQRKVPRTITETYQSPVYKTVTTMVTTTVYDREPIYRQVNKTTYHPRESVQLKSLPPPANGIVFVEGDVIGLRGDIVGRLTIATGGTIRITANLVYRDSEGDPAYLNGTRPDRPYESNPAYENCAALGLIAQKNILYGYEVPDNFEINASVLSLEGRVGIDGVWLNPSNGEVVAANRPLDEFGRLQSRQFLKNSIRRLGGITTCRRPVDTVVTEGKVTSGFRRGTSAFDLEAVQGPPPFYLASPVPRFFATQVVK